MCVHFRHQLQRPKLEDSTTARLSANARHDRLGAGECSCFRCHIDSRARLASQNLHRRPAELSQRRPGEFLVPDLRISIDFNRYWIHPPTSYFMINVKETERKEWEHSHARDGKLMARNTWNCSSAEWKVHMILFWSLKSQVMTFSQQTNRKIFHKFTNIFSLWFPFSNFSFYLRAQEILKRS